MEEQAFVFASVGCFAIDFIYLALQLLSEIDASRRGVRELLRHGLLQESETHVARRILRTAFGTYLAGVAATVFALTLILPQVGWHDPVQPRRAASLNL
jgi:Zn-dependent membrane protease YugP